MGLGIGEAAGGKLGEMDEKAEDMGFDKSSSTHRSRPRRRLGIFVQKLSPRFWERWMPARCLSPLGRAQQDGLQGALGSRYAEELGRDGLDFHVCEVTEVGLQALRAGGVFCEPEKKKPDSSFLRFRSAGNLDRPLGRRRRGLVSEACRA